MQFFILQFGTKRKKMNSGKTFLGYRVVASCAADLTDDIFARLKSGGVSLVVDCLNPHSVGVAANDPEFYSALIDADYLLPDGWQDQRKWCLLSHQQAQCICFAKLL